MMMILNGHPNFNKKILLKLCGRTNRKIVSSNCKIISVWGKGKAATSSGRNNQRHLNSLIRKLYSHGIEIQRQNPGRGAHFLFRSSRPKIGVSTGSAES